MKRKRVKIEFYQVTNKLFQNVFFEDLISAVHGLPANDDSRSLDDTEGGYFLRMQTAQRSTAFWEGEVLRVRMDDLSVKADRRGNVAPFNLKQDEGMGNGTAFLFVPEISVLVIQRGQHAVSARALVEYFEEMSGVHGYFPDACLQLDVIERLQRMTEVRRLKIGIAGIRNIERLSNEGRTLGSMLNTANSVNGSGIKVEVSMRHDKGSLTNVWATVQSLLGLKEKHGDVRSVVVSGVDENGDSDILDILKYKLVAWSEEIETGAGRNLPYEARAGAVRSAWREKADDVRKIVGAPGV